MKDLAVIPGILRPLNYFPPQNDKIKGNYDL